MQIRAKGEAGRWVQLTLEEEEWQRIHRDLLPPDALPATVATVQEADHLFDQIARRGALRYLGRLLSQRELLSTQLQSRLEQRGLTRVCALELVSECLEKGFIDDRRWVEGYLRGQKRRLRGPLAISARLRGKGVAPTLIDEAVQLSCTPEEQRAAIEALLEGRLKSYDRDKRYRALVRRGFDSDLIRERLK